MGKLNEIAQKAYECAVRRGKIDPDNDIGRASCRERV